MTIENNNTNEVIEKEVKSTTAQYGARIEQDLADKMKDYAKQYNQTGKSVSDLFREMINAYEVKEVSTVDSSEIREFENLATRMTEIFINSIKKNETNIEMINNRNIAAIENRDKTIADLNLDIEKLNNDIKGLKDKHQNELNEKELMIGKLKEERNSLTNANNELEQGNISLQEDKKDLEKELKKEKAEKKKYFDKTLELNSKLTEFENKANAYNSLVLEKEQVEKQRDNLTIERDNLLNKINDLNDKLITVSTEKAIEVATLKATAEVTKAELNRVVNELNNKKQNTKDITEIEEVLESIKQLKNMEADEVENEITIAFGDYEFEGESSVVVSSKDQMNCFVASEGMHSAYIDHADADVITFKLEKEEDGSFSVVDAYIY